MDQPVKRHSGGGHEDSCGGKVSKRMPNPTHDEKRTLVEYMAAHTNYANGRVKGKDARNKMREMHQKLANKVNKVKNEVHPTTGQRKKGGPDRSGEQWWKTWISLRNSTKDYAAKNYKRKDQQTGGGADDSISSIADPVESRDCEYTCDDELCDIIMNIIGWHNALGMAVKDDLMDDTSKEGNKENSPPDELENGACGISFSAAATSTPGKCKPLQVQDRNILKGTCSSCHTLQCKVDALEERINILNATVESLVSALGLQVVEAVEASVPDTLENIAYPVVEDVFLGNTSLNCEDFLKLT